MILFIDDEPRWVEAYREELEASGYHVVLISDVDEALLFWSAHRAEVELVILDIMMPSGRAFRDADTRRGLRTGIHFYKELRSDAPTLPFIVLSNVSDPGVEREYEGEPHCRFLHKYEYLPHEIKDIVREEIAVSQEGGRWEI